MVTEYEYVMSGTVKNRAALFSDLFSQTVGRTERHHNETELFSPDVLNFSFQNLAYDIWCDNCDSAEREGDNKQLLLLTYYVKENDAKGNISFFHKSFYDYFLSLYFYNKLKESIKDKNPDTFLEKLAERRLEPDIIEFISELKENDEHPIENSKLKLVLDRIEESECMGIDTKDRTEIKGNADALKYDRNNNIFVNSLNILFCFDIVRIFNKLEHTKKLMGKFSCSNLRIHCGSEKVDLGNCFFYRANLSKADLSGADFSRTKIGEVKLSDANLNGVNFIEADLSGADLSGANLNGANLNGANLNGANLNEANLNGANLNGADLSEANLSGVNLIGVNLSGVNLSRADLSGADLSGADLSGADLIGANLILADLIGADLSGADLSEANLRGACLSGANFSRASLTLADLSAANLSGANLSRVDLIVANLRGVDLSGADLSGANLSGANFGIIYFGNVILNEKLIIEVNLSGANFDGTDLSGADFSGVNFSGADFSGAKLRKEDYEQLASRGADLNGVCIIE